MELAMGAHPCLQILAYIMGRLGVSHSCRMDASTTSRLSCHTLGRPRILTITGNGFRRNHSSKVDEIRPRYCEMNLRRKRYSYMVIATILARSTGDHGRHPAAPGSTQMTPKKAIRKIRSSTTKTQ